MKILFITDNFPPEVNAPATRTFEHCREWVKLGADVTVITCFPNFPKGEVYEGYKNSLYKFEIMEGIKVLRVWSYITSNSGFIKRIFDFISFSITAFAFGLHISTDVIIATSPQFFTALAGRTLAKITRKPWIMEVRDLWPEQILAISEMKRNLLIKYLEKEAYWCYKSADRIVTVTDSYKKKIIARGINGRKIHIVKNGFSSAGIRLEKDQIDTTLKKYNIPDKLIVGYIGTHGLSQNLPFVIEALKDFSDLPDVLFLFVGDGAAKEACISLTRELSITNIRFLPQVEKQEVYRLISRIDIALVPLKKEELFKTVIPSKIFEQAAFGKPILLGVDGEARELIESTKSGLYFEPENREDFIAQLKVLIENKNIRDQLAHGALQLAKQYSREMLAQEMLHIIKNVGSNPNV